jgi:hypothetical protein
MPHAMNLRVKKWAHLLAVTVCLIASHVTVQSDAHFSSQDGGVET